MELRRLGFYRALHSDALQLLYTALRKRVLSIGADTNVSLTGVPTVSAQGGRVSPTKHGSIEPHSA